jgi:hypothetical protein
MDVIMQTAYAKMAGIDPPKFDPRTGQEEPKRRVRVVMPSTTMHVVPGGHRLEQGENFIIVYESDLAKMMANELETATEGDLRDVRREYDRQVERWRTKNEGADMRTCPVSFEAAFQHVMGRAMRCITEIEDLGPLDVGPAPASDGLAPASKRAKAA